MQEHRPGHNILERHLLHWQLFPFLLAIRKSYRPLQEKQVFILNLYSSQYFKNSESSGELFTNHICNTHFFGTRGHELHFQQEGEGYFRSWNHKTPWVGRDFQILSNPTPLPWARTIFHWAQSPIQPDFEWWWAMGSFSGRHIPVSHQTHHKKALPYVQSKPTIFQFKTVVPSPVTKGPDSLSLSFLQTPFE